MSTVFQASYNLTLKALLVITPEALSVKRTLFFICSSTVVWLNDSLVPNVIFESRPDLESL